MSPERSGIAPIQKMDQIENNALETKVSNAPEVLSPEVLSPEKVRVLIPYDPELAHYNAAVIQSKKNNGEILILLREVPTGTVVKGEPDKGPLLIYRALPGGEKAEKVKELKLDHPGVVNWEDARTYVSNNENDQEIENEKVLIGLTAIRKADNHPMAATIEGEMIDGNFSVKFESLNVYPNDEGKNVTPISPNESLFRRNGHCRSLEVVEHGVDEKGQNKLKIKKIINFPEKPWCEWQIGTQAQMLPNWILPIHGVNRYVSGKDSQGNDIVRYSYSLGLAQMDKNLNLIKISDMPVFTRESFKNILAMGKEMDPNKDVVYCCGYSVVGDTVKFVINIGDLMTVEVSKKLSELQGLLDQSSIEPEQLDQSSIIEPEQILKNATIFQKSA